MDEVVESQERKKKEKKREKSIFSIELLRLALSSSNKQTHARLITSVSDSAAGYVTFLVPDSALLGPSFLPWHIRCLTPYSIRFYAQVCCTPVRNLLL